MPHRVCVASPPGRHGPHRTDQAWPGSAALLFSGHDAVFVGDALATHSVTTGDDGPQISPFTADPVEALASLDRLGGVEAGLVLPGHGQAWRGGVAAAVAAVRTSAAASPTPGSP